MTTCELCQLTAGATAPGGASETIWRNDQLTVIMVNDPNYPGFCRVVWNDHVREMTDLLPAERGTMMDAVWLVEQAVREVMDPDKVNLASLGNVVPHLHWHVIPRYTDDAHFPNPVWAAPARTADESMLVLRRGLAARLATELVLRLEKGMQ